MSDISMRNESLITIEKALDEIYNETIPVSRILMRCQRVVMQLKSEEQNRWIWWELEGYPHPNYNREHRESIPDYRWHSLFYEITGSKREPLEKLLQLSAAMIKGRFPFPVTDPCSTLERAQNKIEVRSKFRWEKEFFEKEPYTRAPMLIPKDINVDVRAFLGFNDIQSTLAGVRSKVHQFLISQRNALLVETASQGLLDDSMNLIASRLQHLDPELLSGIATMVKKQELADFALDWNNVSSTCRTVIQRFTELIYLDEMTPNDEKHPQLDKTMDKCRNITRWALDKIGKNKEDMPEASRIEGVPDFLDNYYYAFIKSVQKVMHKDTRKLLKDEVDRVVLYLILWLADLIRLLDRADYDWS